MCDLITVCLSQKKNQPRLFVHFSSAKPGATVWSGEILLSMWGFHKNSSRNNDSTTVFTLKDSVEFVNFSTLLVKDQEFIVFPLKEISVFIFFGDF